MRYTRRFLLAAVCLAVAMASTLAGAQPIFVQDFVIGPAAAAPERPPLEGPFVKLVNVATGTVIGIGDDGSEDGAKAILANDGKNEAREWKVTEDGDFIKLVNRKSRQALDVYGANKEEETAIIQW